MKTKHWIAILLFVLVLCAGLSLKLLVPGKAATYAEISSEGKIIETVDLRIAREIIVTNSKGGTNIITIQGGKIGVTEADCPDHYCMHRGMCNNGAQIVCLPNLLVIQFTEPQEIDIVVG